MGKKANKKQQVQQKPTQTSPKLSIKSSDGMPEGPSSQAPAPHNGSGTGCPIMKLSNEVLDAIFQKSKCAKELRLVCQRFHGVVDQVLWSDMAINPVKPPLSKKMGIWGTITMVRVRYLSTMRTLNAPPSDMPILLSTEEDIEEFLQGIDDVYKHPASLVKRLSFLKPTVSTVRPISSIVGPLIPYLPNLRRLLLDSAVIDQKAISCLKKAIDGDWANIDISISFTQFTQNEMDFCSQLGEAITTVSLTDRHSGGNGNFLVQYPILQYTPNVEVVTLLEDVILDAASLKTFFDNNIESLKTVICSCQELENEAGIKWLPDTVTDFQITSTDSDEDKLDDYYYQDLSEVTEFGKNSGRNGRNVTKLRITGDIRQTIDTFNFSNVEDCLFSLEYENPENFAEFTFAKMKNLKTLCLEEFTTSPFKYLQPVSSTLEYLEIQKTTELYGEVSALKDMTYTFDRLKTLVIKPRDDIDNDQRESCFEILKEADVKCPNLSWIIFDNDIGKLTPIKDFSVYDSENGEWVVNVKYFRESIRI